MCRETWAWDVRTKHVTYEPVPTVEEVRGLASYGPTATLFTLGPNHTVQQYDLENPQMVANVQHVPPQAPPTPPDDPQPISIDAVATQVLPSHSASGSEDEGAVISPIKRTTFEMNAIESSRRERNGSSSPRSTRSRAESFSSHPSKRHDRTPLSPTSKAAYSGTTFSIGSPSQASTREKETPLLTGTSWAYPSTASTTSTKSHRKESRLRQEVLPSPEDKPVVELFPYTRARLSDVPYKPPRPLDEFHLTPDDLRRQMLSVVFGWDHDIEDLIRDESMFVPQVL